MMVKMGGSGAAAEKVVQLLLRRRALRTFLASRRVCVSCQPFGERDGATIGKLQTIFVQAAVQSQARYSRSVSRTIDFLPREEKKTRAHTDQGARRTVT